MRGFQADSKQEHTKERSVVRENRGAGERGERRKRGTGEYPKRKVPCLSPYSSVQHLKEPFTLHTLCHPKQYFHIRPLTFPYGMTRERIMQETGLDIALTSLVLVLAVLRCNENPGNRLANSLFAYSVQSCWLDVCACIV